MNALLGFVLIVIVFGILAALKAKNPTMYEGLAFEKRDPLFTPAERSFLGVLEQVLDSRYRVLGKVRLGDLVKPILTKKCPKNWTLHNQDVRRNRTAE